MHSAPVPDPSPSSLPPFARTGRKLGVCVLGFVLAVVGVITLEPFAFAVPHGITLTYWDGWFDPVANVMLFVPPGFLFALTRSATTRGDGTAAATRRTLLVTGLLALAVSGSIECIQAFEPSRYPSPTDVATNTFGAILGAWLHARVARRLELDTPIVGRLALELPLVGLLYIMLPLLTLAALTVRGGTTPSAWPAMLPVPRAWALLALALFGGTILGHVQRRHLGPARALDAKRAALVGAVWFAVGAMPAVATAPVAFVAGVIVTAAATWAYGRGDHTVVSINRRFELDTLGRASPWLIGYLALVPLTDPVARSLAYGKLDVVRQVEAMAGFAIFGYVLAEAWGRFELRYRFVAWRVVFVGALGAASAEIMRRMALPPLDALPTIGAQVFAAAYGGWIYHLQRAHVRALVLGRRAATTSVPTAARDEGGATGRVYRFPTPALTATARATTPPPAARSGRATRPPM